MASGIVKWFDSALGYGYISPADGSPEIFVHFTALDSAGLKALDPGQRISFDISKDGGVTRATNLSSAVAA